MAGQPAWVDHGVPDLPGVSGATAERETPRDDAGADAGVPREVDGVINPRCGATHMLGPDAEVGVIAHPHWQPQRLGQLGADGSVLPTEVGRLAHLAVAAPHHAGDRHAGADQDGAALDLGEKGGADLADGPGHVALATGATAVGAVNAREDRSAQSDPRHRQMGHPDVDGEHLDALGLRRHDVRRAPAAARRAVVDPLGPTRLLADQTGGDQFAREITDRAAVEPEDGGESAACGRAVYVNVAQQGGEVAPPDVLGPRPTRTLGKDRHEGALHPP
jgi:hypothetical protein